MSPFEIQDVESSRNCSTAFLTCSSRSMKHWIDGMAAWGSALPSWRSLVEMHGGTVTALSKGEGQGCEFTVRLPLSLKPVDAHPLGHPSEPLPPAAHQDGSQATQDTENAVPTRVLTHKGQCRTAPDDANAAGIGGPPRCGRGEWQTRTGRLAARPPRRRAGGHRAPGNGRLRDRPSCAPGVDWQPGASGGTATSYGQQKDRAAVLEAGFDEHLVKPVDPHELARVLKRPIRPK